MTVHGRDCRSGGEERGMGGGGEGEEGGEGVNTLKSSIAPIRNGSKTEEGTEGGRAGGRTGGRVRARESCLRKLVKCAA